MLLSGLNCSFVLILSCLSHSLIAAKRHTTVNNQVKDVDDMMESILNCRETGTAIPGISLSVVRQGRVVMSRGYGVKDIDHPQPVTENTLFGIGPVTKTFTSTLLAKLLHNHPRFSLQTPISTMIDNFRFRDSLRTANASLEDLLAQRMGLVPHAYMVFQNHLTRKKLANKMHYVKPVAKFRDSYIYSDLMYGLAAHVTEHLSSQKWETTMTEQLLHLLEMNGTTFLNTFNPVTCDVATPYLTEDQVRRGVSFHSLREATKLGGGRSILSNAADMSKWMLFHLSQGQNKNGKRVVNQRALRNTHKATSARPTSTEKYFQKPHTPVSWTDHSISMGWKNGFYRGYPILSSMWSPKWSPPIGYQSFTTLFPTHGLGIFTAHNGKETHFLLQTALHAFISDVFLKQDIWLNASSICTFPKTWQTLPQTTPRPPTKKDRELTRKPSYYMGIFYNGIYGRIVVYHNKTLNRIQLQYGEIKCQLYASSSTDTFNAEGTGDFWFFSITVIFQLEINNGYLSISEFVPKHPARFKKTHSEVPQEFYSGPVATNDPTSTATVHLEHIVKPGTSSERVTEAALTRVPTWNRWSSSSGKTEAIIAISARSTETTDSTSFITNTTVLETSPTGYPSSSKTSIPLVSGLSFSPRPRASLGTSWKDTPISIIPETEQVSTRTNTSEVSSLNIKTTTRRATLATSNWERQKPQITTLSDISTNQETEIETTRITTLLELSTDQETEIETPRATTMAKLSATQDQGIETARNIIIANLSTTQGKDIETPPITTAAEILTEQQREIKRLLGYNSSSGLRRGSTMALHSTTTSPLNHSSDYRTHSTVYIAVQSTSSPSAPVSQPVEIPANDSHTVVILESESEHAEDKLDQNNNYVVTKSGVAKTLPVSVLYFLNILIVTLTASYNDFSGLPSQ